MTRRSWIALLVFVCFTACAEDDTDGDGVEDSLDCAPTVASVTPGAREIPYNGVDDDCDPETRDDDLDGDRFGRAVGGDCNDEDAAIFPGADETADDGIDQDCSGRDLTDVDRDGSSAPADCDDARPDVKPSGVEVCGDGIDQDCAGGDLLCSTVDGDGDTVSSADGDCNDRNPEVNPNVTERTYNGIDDDCDPATRDDDLDEDGFSRQGGGDCDDAADTVFPGADEVPYDSVDQDCSGTDLVDVDRDGSPSPADCDDTRPDVKPTGVDICGDGVDQDCRNGPLLCADVDGDGDGVTPSAGDCDDTTASIRPGLSETAYNGRDDDCDPATPDDDLDADGFSRNGGGDCDDAADTVFPGADEVPYDDIDQDCSGSDLTDLDRDGFDGGAGDDCDDRRPDVFPGAFDVCDDGVNQDCTGGDKLCFPRGVLKNLDPADLVGWTECHTSGYGSTTSVASMQAACNRTNVMVACRRTGTATLVVAAQAHRNDVFSVTGTGANATREANGVAWYFDLNWSMGFAPAGAEVFRSSCDTGVTPGARLVPDERLCFHTGASSFQVGWRCGADEALFDNTWERVLLHR